jgi:hypothetical protein
VTATPLFNRKGSVGRLPAYRVGLRCSWAASSGAPFENRRRFIKDGPIGQGGVDHRKAVPYVRVQLVIGELGKRAGRVRFSAIEADDAAR